MKTNETAPLWEPAKEEPTGLSPEDLKAWQETTARLRAVATAVAQPEFVDDYLSDLLDGLGKGFSIVETIWDRTGKEWWPSRYEWRAQQHFQIDEIDGRTVRLKDPMTRHGIDLPPFQFSIHRPKLKSGLPIRGGLARLAAWAFLFKHYSLKDWMSFLEVYGMPLRVGKFGRGASHEDRRILLQAVRDISTDAAAIIPKEMDIEFVEVAGSSGNNLFSAMTDYLDRQVSKGVLGQTMTTDDGSSMAQAQIHENVRHDIARADARQTAVTCNRDLIRPFVDLNFGPQDYYPTILFPITEAEDVKALAEVISTLVPLGLEVGMAGVRKRIGFEDPEPGEALMKAAAKPAEAEPATARRREPCPDCGGHHALAADQRDEIDLLVEEALADWQSDVDPLFEPLRELFANARDYAELKTGLASLAERMEDGPLAARIAKIMMKARGLGDLGQGR